MPDLRKCIYCGGRTVFEKSWPLKNGRRKNVACKDCLRAYTLTFNKHGECVDYKGMVQVARAEKKAARRTPLLSDNQRRWEAALKPEPENELLSPEEIRKLLPTVTTPHLRARLEAVYAR